MFSACLRLSTSTSKLPFLVFLTVFGLALIDITFSIRKGESLARHTSSKDSITMNLWKSAVLFSESDSERFRLVLSFFHLHQLLGGFVLKNPYIYCLSFIDYAPHPPRSPTG